MSPEILILIGLSSLSLYVSQQQLKNMRQNKNSVKECARLDKVDCGCGCSSMKMGRKDLRYDYFKNSVNFD